MPLPLKDIIAALVNDVSIASIRADVNRSHWQDIYDDNEIFREFSPSKVRISELNVSIPLAIEDVQREKMIDPAITSRVTSTSAAGAAALWCSTAFFNSSR